MNILPLLSTATNTTEVDGAAMAVMTIGLGLFMLILLIATYVIVAVLLGRIFKKAGIDSWKAWVPVYNTWLTLELGNQKGWWAIVTIIPFVNIVASVFLYIAMYQIGLKFGKNGAFVLWAIFLPLVWYAWLALDDSVWRGTPAIIDQASNPPTVPAT